MNSQCEFQPAGFVACTNPVDVNSAGGICESCWDKIVSGDSVAIRLGATVERVLPDGVEFRFVTDPDWRVRQAMARRPDLNVQGIQRLANPDVELNVEVLRTVAVHPNLDSAAHELVWKATDPQTLAFVASNPSTPKIELETLASHPDPAVSGPASYGLAHGSKPVKTIWPTGLPIGAMNLRAVNVDSPSAGTRNKLPGIGQRSNKSGAAQTGNVETPVPVKNVKQRVGWIVLAVVLLFFVAAGTLTKPRKKHTAVVAKATTAVTEPVTECPANGLIAQTQRLAAITLTGACPTPTMVGAVSRTSVSGGIVAVVTAWQQTQASKRKLVTDTFKTISGTTPAPGTINMILKRDAKFSDILGYALAATPKVVAAKTVPERGKAIAETVFGPNVTPKEIATLIWVASNGHLKGVANFLSTWQPFVAQVLTGTVKTMLGRAPTVAQQKQLMPILVAGHGDPNTIRAFIAGSPQFLTYAQTQPAIPQPGLW